MRIIHTISEMQSASEEIRCEHRRIGFVPTMGYLHEGHLSLIRIAKSHADCTVVSIFVNPTQFSAGEDFDRYPRNVERDIELLDKEDVDILFIPSTTDMYPAGARTSVLVEGISHVLEGMIRPTHFKGVATIITKLFHSVKPHVAVFGQKDAQQAVIIRNLVRDLNFDIDIIIGPTVRDSDGLAMSSRNTYLSDAERADALRISQALFTAHQRFASGERNTETLKRTMHDIITKSERLLIDYTAIVDPETMVSFQHIPETGALAVIAVRQGKIRLIDAMVLSNEEGQ